MPCGCNSIFLQCELASIISIVQKMVSDGLKSKQIGGKIPMFLRHKDQNCLKKYNFFSFEAYYQ